jgi:RNA polymerase sigma-70 factor (ECF subfamily)
MNNNTFQNLLQGNRNRVYNYARYFLRNNEDAEDVTQEVFVKMWQRCTEQNPDRIPAWLMRVTHNLCIDVTRRRKTSVGWHVSADQVEPDSLPAQRSAGDPEASFRLNETQKSLLDAMATLPARTRSIMLMHYFQGFTYEAISEILQVRLNTVKVAVHRGRKSLRKKLTGYDPGYVETRANEPAVS